MAARFFNRGYYLVLNHSLKPQGVVGSALADHVRLKPHLQLTI